MVEKKLVLITGDSSPFQVPYADLHELDRAFQKRAPLFLHALQSAVHANQTSQVSSVLHLVAM